MFKLHAASRLRILAAPDAPIGGAVEDDLDIEPEWLDEAWSLLKKQTLGLQMGEVDKENADFIADMFEIGSGANKADANLDKFLKARKLCVLIKPNGKKVIIELVSKR